MSEKINIGQIAELARLNLKAEEREKLSKDLGSILEYVEQLRELNTDSVEPTTHALALENVYRKDVCKPSEVSQAVLNHAPKREGNFFKVPKVIEGQ